MSGKQSTWKRPFGSKQATSKGARPRSSANRPRRKSPYLAIQELESRTLLSVTASLTSGVLDVNLSAAQDSAQITPSGSTISVTGISGSVTTNFGPFSGVTAIVKCRAPTRPARTIPTKASHSGAAAARSLSRRRAPTP